jgi:hypothetical protein
MNRDMQGEHRKAMYGNFIVYIASSTHYSSVYGSPMPIIQVTYNLFSVDLISTARYSSTGKLHAIR